MLKKLRFVVVLIGLVSACVHKADNDGKDKRPGKEELTSPKPAPSTESAGLGASESRQTADPDCILRIPNGDDATIPKFLAAGPLVVTHMLKPCEDPTTGKLGFLKQSTWTAMGFPCTAGGARYDWKGSTYNPKLLLFPLSNACPMSPSNPELITKLVVQSLGLDKSASMVAYFPFSLMYWELADGSDADTSNQIEVVTAGNYAFRWKDFQAQEAIKVRLYGKQNSFTPSPVWYEVDAGLLRDLRGQGSFKLTVESVRILDQEALQEVRQRCLDLSPRRRCRQVFGN